MRRWSQVLRPPVPEWVITTPDDGAAEAWCEDNGHDFGADEVLGARLSIPRPGDTPTDHRPPPTNPEIH